MFSELETTDLNGPNSPFKIALVSLLRTIVPNAKFINQSKQFAENMNDDEFREWRDGV